VITSRFSANRRPSFILALSLLESDSACANLVATHVGSRRVSATKIREWEVVGIDLIGRIDALEVGEHSLAFWGLGQVGVAIKGPGGVIYVDPYLTDSDGAGGSLPRTFPPPLSPAEVTNAAVVLLTHVHIDHTDPDTVLPLSGASPEARFVASFTSSDALVEAGLDEDRIFVPEVGEPVEVARARVTALPSSHTELEHDPERGYPYLGYVIEWNGVTVYHAGDTVVYDGLIETLSAWDIDIAFVPINGRDYFRTERGIVGNADLRETAELTETLDIGLIVPTHYDLIEGNTVDPGHFVSHLYSLNPMRPQKLLRPGELLYFVKYPDD
jgi:L-ascorbate metabolism protein UlaG (beta-lactamase superfamily)